MADYLHDLFHQDGHDALGSAYDAHGVHVGGVQHNAMGGWDHHDAAGAQMGHSTTFGNQHSVYDHHGVKVADSHANTLGGEDHYDAHGVKLGHSMPNAAGGVDEYNAAGIKVGHSAANSFHGRDHYDAHGVKLGAAMGGSSLADWQHQVLSTTGDPLHGFAQHSFPSFL